jgi:hypothetical protein
VAEVDGYRVHVAVAQDVRFPDQFQCEVSLYPRDADSQWSDLDLSKPVEEPQSSASSARRWLRMNMALPWDTY